jgi:hypothetical protein
MDETPEELEQIRREAAQIDPYRYQRRRRAMAAVALGMVGAGVAWVVLEAVDKARNPCERVMSYYCAKDPGSLQCKSYQGMRDDSKTEESGQMRSEIRAQCLTRIERLKADDGIVVP